MVAAVRLVTAAGALDGRGHVGRALALGAALRRRSARVAVQLVRGSLTSGEAARAEVAGLVAVGADSSAEAGTIVVVDVPDVNEVAARHDPSLTVVFDDRDQFAGRAAIVVQPSLPTWSGSGAAARRLAGYRYVPIGAEYRQRRETAPVVVGGRDGRRVLACFGGSDPQRVTARLVSALAGAALDLDVVVGASYQGSLEDLPVDPVRDPPDLPDRLAGADLAVLGAGTMKFEAACLGRPAILVAVADDQLVGGAAFAATGAAVFLGDGRTLEPDRVARSVRELLADPDRRAALGAAGRAAIDGLGADRLAAEVLALA